MSDNARTARAEVRKAERRALAAMRDAQPLSIETREVPGLKSDSAMRSVAYAKGIVRLSEFYGVGGPPPLFPKNGEKPKLRLKYEA